jgi:hypothetical protein
MRQLFELRWKYDFLMENEDLEYDYDRRIAIVPLYCDQHPLCYACYRGMCERTVAVQ